MQAQKTFSIHTLGCKLNFAESAAIARQMEDAGLARVDFSAEANYYLINTCSVTDNADKKCRAAVRQVRARAPEAEVIIVGCYAQLKPEEIAAIPGVSAVLGANDKFNIPDHLDEISSSEKATVKAGEIREVDFYVEAWSSGERTRTFLKVQDGCDYFCSFCTIPLARGRSRSPKMEEVLNSARKIGESQVLEVVLSGVNIGDFGKKADGRGRSGENFYELIRELDKIEGIDRFRISSIEPNLLEDRIIDFVAQSDRFMPHFHIPLQSGSDEMLRQMRRKYDTSLYERRIARIREVMPHACIGVDVIVGFPGESQAEFDRTREFLANLDISYLHVFTYSERANTKAENMPDAVPMGERRERSRTLRQLSERKRRIFNERFVGDSRPVLFEQMNDDGIMHGFTDNYIKVSAAYDPELVNRIRKVEIGKIGASLSAEISFAEKAATH